MFGSLFRKSSKLIEHCKTAFEQGGEKAVKAYIEALSSREKAQLAVGIMNAEMDMVEQCIISSINQEVEDIIPFKGFSNN